ncbi:hypothetical protein E2320_011158 [Naja naja]|nr:hypothetical protein E2320_011158 [Naja naja]
MLAKNSDDSGVTSFEKASVPGRIHTQNANYEERKQHCAGMRQEQNQAQSIEKQYSREFWSQKITFGLRQNHE